MAQFSGMSTGTTLGKGLEEFYKNNPNYFEDIEKIKDFIAKNTNYKVVKIQASKEQAIIHLEGFSNEL